MTHLILVGSILVILTALVIHFTRRREYLSAAIIAVLVFGIIFAFLPRAD